MGEIALTCNLYSGSDSVREGLRTPKDVRAFTLKKGIKHNGHMGQHGGTGIEIGTPLKCHRTPLVDGDMATVYFNEITPSMQGFMRYNSDQLCCVG